MAQVGKKHLVAAFAAGLVTAVAVFAIWLSLPRQEALRDFFEYYMYPTQIDRIQANHIWPLGAAEPSAYFDANISFLNQGPILHFVPQVPALSLTRDDIAHLCIDFYTAGEDELRIEYQLTADAFSRVKALFASQIDSRGFGPTIELKSYKGDRLGFGRPSSPALLNFDPAIHNKPNLFSDSFNNPHMYWGFQLLQDLNGTKPVVACQAPDDLSSVRLFFETYDLLPMLADIENGQAIMAAR